MEVHSAPSCKNREVHVEQFSGAPIPKVISQTYNRGANPKTNFGKPCNKFVKHPLTFLLLPPTHSLHKTHENPEQCIINEFEFTSCQVSQDFDKYHCLQKAFSISTYSPNSQTQLL